MPDIVVSNTTPIITLLGVEQFELLKHIYQEIIIPTSVYNEIEAGKDKPFYADLTQFDWIKIIAVQDELLVNSLESFLDKGEAETICLAMEQKADALLIDERAARNYAILQGLKCVGSFGVLLKAKDLGLIPAIKPLLIKAQENGIRMSEKLIKQILTEANENER